MTLTLLSPTNIDVGVCWEGYFGRHFHFRECKSSRRKPIKMNMHVIYFHSFKKHSEKEYYLKWKMQKNRNETMLLLHWPEWSEPEAAGEQGVWQWCDIMTSNSPCGWKVCLLPLVSQGMERERETKRERENWQASMSMWGAGKGKEVARENVTNDKERGWQRETGRQVSVHVKEKEGAKEQEWRPLSIWNTHQTRTKETFPSPNSTLMSDLQSLSIMYCKSSQNLHIHKFECNNLI